jgi:hypothetical protein
LRAESRTTGAGWVLIIVGLFLTIAVIGIPLILIGVTRREQMVQCPKHGPVMMSAVQAEE